MSLDLEIRDLIKIYPAGVTVGPISLEVKAGEFFSFLGPSGCGKTTTLRCIAGFESISEGAIALGGERIDTKPPHKRDIGLVFQDYALFPHLTVFDNIAFGLKLRKRSRREIEDRVGKALSMVALSGVGQRYPAQLSGGQQQRIAIARSLVLEPRLVLMDEPLSNLDLKLRVQMRYELRRLQRQLGTTSIYVTHDQVEALALSDRIAILSEGRVVQVGTPAEIYRSPKTSFVADFVGNSNLLKATVCSTVGNNLVVRTEHGVALFARADGIADGSEVMLLVRPERIGVDPVGPDSQGATNRIAGTIDAVTFLGEDLHLRVGIGPELKLLVAVKNVGSADQWKEGQNISLFVDPADVQVLRQ